jgi:hypothetical protein
MSARAVNNRDFGDFQKEQDAHHDCREAHDEKNELELA